MRFPVVQNSEHPWEYILEHLTTSGLHFINFKRTQANCQLGPNLGHFFIWAKFERVSVYHWQACTTLMDLSVILANIRSITVNLREHQATFAL